MGLFGDIMLGLSLTRLTNIHEELLLSRTKGFIGAGGGVDSLPLHRQLDIQKKYPKLIGELKGYEKHEVTRALFKNLQAAEFLGKANRVQAMEELFSVLVAQGVALDVDSFTSSYL